MTGEITEGPWRKDQPTESWYSLSLNKASMRRKQSGRSSENIFTMKDVSRGSGVVRDLMSKESRDNRKILKVFLSL